jgi:hypothetical protein
MDTDEEILADADIKRLQHLAAPIRYGAVA